MSYFSSKASSLIAPPPTSIQPPLRRRPLYLALVDPPSCHTRLRAALSFALAGGSVSSRCAVLVTPLPLNAQPPPPASHSPLVLPGWLSGHFSLRRLCLTSPLVAPPPLIDVPAGCCVASRRAASVLRQLSSIPPKNCIAD